MKCFDVYIGVMIDDLVIKGIKEFYCLLISWVEYWLILCYDNVDFCLMEKGYVIGLVFDECLVVMEEKK